MTASESPQKPIAESISVKTPTVSGASNKFPSAGLKIHKVRLNNSKETHLQWSFRVRGNPEWEAGNPLPKAKLTKGQQWTEKAKRYVNWKGHVSAALIDAARGTELWPMIVRNIGLLGKPLTSKRHAPVKMDLMIHWNGDKHADPENVFGSIADSLFKQDKYLKGSFDFQDGTDFFGVEVTITM